MSCQKRHHDVHGNQLLRTLDHTQHLDLLLGHQTVAALAFRQGVVKETIKGERGDMSFRAASSSSDEEGAAPGDRPPTYDQPWNPLVRLVDVTDRESDASSDLVDVHIRGSLQFHAVLVHTISGIYRLEMNAKTKRDVRMSVHETGNHTMT